LRASLPPVHYLKLTLENDLKWIEEDTEKSPKMTEPEEENLQNMYFLN
jgi:hypothetical protein